MPKILTCDKCGASDASEDYSGRILCEYHRAEVDLRDLRHAYAHAYAEKKAWVDQCWLSKLDAMRYEIELLERFFGTSGKRIGEG